MSSLLLFSLSQVGARVEVYVRNVPKDVFESRNPAVPFYLFGLFEHEHKQSVLHFVVQRNTEYSEPVRSKVHSHPSVLASSCRR